MPVASMLWFSSGGFFFKQFLEQRAFGLFPFIPKSKIQTIVVLELFVVQCMVRSANQPFACFVFMKVFGIHFNIEVVNNTAERHNG